MEDNLIIQIGRTLAKPWKQDISPRAAVVVFILFAIVVWWSLDSLNVLSKMQNFIKETVE